MDWCSIYLAPQGLPKYIYLSPPLIFPTTYNGIRTKNHPVWITSGTAPIRWMGPIHIPRWEQKRTGVTLSYLGLHVCPMALFCITEKASQLACPSTHSLFCTFSHTLRNDCKLSCWKSEWLLFNAKWEIYCYIMARATYIQWNDVHFVLDQHA
jgi:hypothetical protein